MGPFNLSTWNALSSTAFYTKVRGTIFTLYEQLSFVYTFWASIISFNLVGSTAETLFEDAVEFVCSVHLMLIVGLATAAANVSLGPLAEAGHDLLDAAAWILAIVTFCIDKVKLIGIGITTASIGTGIVDFEVGGDDSTIGIAIVQQGLLILNATGLVLFTAAWATMLEPVIVESASLGGSKEGLSLRQIQPLANATAEGVESGWAHIGLVEVGLDDFL